MLYIRAGRGVRAGVRRLRREKLAGDEGARGWRVRFTPTVATRWDTGHAGLTEVAHFGWGPGQTREFYSVSQLSRCKYLPLVAVRNMICDFAYYDTIYI